MRAGVGQGSVEIDGQPSAPWLLDFPTCPVPELHGPSSLRCPRPGGCSRVSWRPLSPTQAEGQGHSERYQLVVSLPAPLQREFPGGTAGIWEGAPEMHRLGFVNTGLFKFRVGPGPRRAPSIFRQWLTFRVVLKHCSYFIQ